MSCRYREIVSVLKSEELNENPNPRLFVYAARSLDGDEMQSARERF